MNRRQLLTGVGGVAAGLADDPTTPRPNDRGRPDPAIEVAAFYFPQYQADPRNDAWHGKGWTEWELVKAARPRFPGHKQPIVPAWGHFDESDPMWAAKEIDLAADHGVTCFLYDWYWYQDGPFLIDGLAKGFLGATNNRRMKFALMWANHEWQNIHPAKFTNKPEALASGKVSLAAFERLTNHAIQNYFSRPNYLKPGGAPYFSIYELGTFVAGMGSMEAARSALDGFRSRTRAAGFPDLHLNAVVWGISVLPSEVKVRDPAAVVRALGFSSVTTYAWVHHYDPNSAGFPRGSYVKAAEANYAAWDRYRKQFPVPYHPNVSMGWDPSPRTVQSDQYESRGYPWTAILEGNTPDAFRQALTRAKDFAKAETGGFRMVTLNAWNEWTEGSYLLPDRERGNAYLDGVRRVFS